MRWLIATLDRDATKFPVNGCCTDPRFLQREALQEFAQIVGDAAPLSVIESSRADKAGEPESALSVHPSLRGPQREVGFSCHARQWLVLFEMSEDEPVMLHRAPPIGFGDLGQGTRARGHRRSRARHHVAPNMFKEPRHLIFNVTRLPPCPANITHDHVLCHA